MTEAPHLLPMGQLVYVDSWWIALPYHHVAAADGCYGAVVMWRIKKASVAHMVTWNDA